MTPTSPSAPGIAGTLDARTGAAVDICDLHRSFGEVRAVRGVDLRIAPGGVVAFLGPNGAGKSTTIDLILGLTRPDRGTVTLFGADPTQAVRTGRVGAMLQSGALLPDLSVRELVSLFTALQPHPLAGGRGTSAGRDFRHRRSAHAEPLRRSGSAGAVGPRDRRRSRPAGARRAHRGNGCRGAPGVLGRHPAVRRLGADRAVRDALPPGSGRLRRPHRRHGAGSGVADGTGASIKEQVSGRRLTPVIPDSTQEQLQALPGVTTIEQVGGRMSLQCSDSDAALRAALAQFPQMHEIEIHQANLEEAFLCLVATEGGAS